MVFFYFSRLTSSNICLVIKSVCLVVLSIVCDKARFVLKRLVKKKTYLLLVTKLVFDLKLVFFETGFCLF